jgi:hypothetical protein
VAAVAEPYGPRGMNSSPELEAARAAVNGSSTAGAAADAAGSGSSGSAIPDAGSTVDGPFEVLPDTPAALPDVQAARARAELARRELQGEVEQLRASARRTFDLRAQLTSIPERIQRDPRRAAIIGGTIAAGVVGISVLRRLRRAKPPTLLPPEVEAAIDAFGTDAEHIRTALNDSFTRYLEAHGARGPIGRLPRGTFVLLVPVVSAVAREAARQWVAYRLRRAMQDEEGDG